MKYQKRNNQKYVSLILFETIFLGLVEQNNILHMPNKTFNDAGFDTEFFLNFIAIYSVRYKTVIVSKTLNDCSIIRYFGVIFRNIKIRDSRTRRNVARINLKS